jgi:hypothetical protein
MTRSAVYDNARQPLRHRLENYSSCIRLEFAAMNSMALNSSDSGVATVAAPLGYFARVMTS